MSLRLQIQVGPETDDTSYFIGWTTSIGAVVLFRESGSNIQVMLVLRFRQTGRILRVLKPMRALLRQAPKQNVHVIRLAGEERGQKAPTLTFDRLRVRSTHLVRSPRRSESDCHEQ